MIYVIAKTKKTFALHKFKDYKDLMEWMQNCVYSFGKLEITHLEVDGK